MTSLGTIVGWIAALLASGARACPRQAQETANLDPLAASFIDPPADARLRMYWRVFGPAWTKEEIDYELDEMERAGVGGAFVYFLYPVALDDLTKGIENVPILSDESLALFAHAASAAQRRGIRLSLNGGTGWPYGGPTVLPGDSAQRLRREVVARGEDASRSAEVELGSNERLLRAFELDGISAPVAAFLAGPTGMQVKRAALGGEGLVLDPLRRDSLERWLDATVEPFLAAAPGQVESIGCDSLEVYGANYTERLPEEFQRRRGYDVVPLLPRLFDDRDPLAADLRFDWWRTVAELAEEEFVAPLGAWAAAHHVKLELEPYGTPPLPLTAARFIDVPTGEHYEWKAVTPARFAASAAHLAGRRTVAMEAWTWAGIPDRLGDTLGDLKLLSDFHFLAGGNDLVGVDFPYSPRGAGAPGWLPYYGPCFNSNHPQWPFFHALAEYIARCQVLLRQGRPVADVALDLPVEDCFSRGSTDQMLLDFALREHFATGETTTEFGLANALVLHSNVVHGLLTHGFDFDVVDFWSLRQSARVEDGRLVAGDGRYSVLVLHDFERVELEALERIAEFCRGGGVVIATRRLPVHGAGLFARDAAVEARVHALILEMFGNEAIEASQRPDAVVAAGRLVAHACGRGRAFFAVDDASSFVDALGTLEPDVRMTSKSSPETSEVSFVHRSLSDREVYFFVNAGSRVAQLGAAFRFDGMLPAPSSWQPLTGAIAAIAGHVDSDGRLAVDLELPARGSLFVVLTRVPCAPLQQAADAVPPVTHPLDVAWDVTFDGPDAPPPRTIRELGSWTEWKDARFFSGRATYSTQVVVDRSSAGARWKLVLPEVRDVAEVRWNGERVATLFTPPFEVDLTGRLSAGTNHLQITVANLPVNRFLSLPDQDLTALRASYGARFPAPEEKRLLREPLPAGLIGAVLLVRE